MRDTEKIAKFGEKKLAVGAFWRAGFGPARDERIGDLNRHPRILRSEGRGANRKGERSEEQGAGSKRKGKIKKSNRGKGLTTDGAGWRGYKKTKRGALNGGPAFI